MLDNTGGVPDATSGAGGGLRSRAWFASEGRNGFLHRSWLRSEGFTPEVFDGRPVIGIANSFSELAPCNAHLRQLADAVKRGVWQAGGFPLEFPTMSLGETLIRPTAMLYRNLMAMEVEESLRANPIDAVVMLSGCDKTTPAMLMGAASAGMPAILVTGGPMLNGRWRGQSIGSGTDVWRLGEEQRRGDISSADMVDAESCMSRSAGHCMTMGTASTMACVAEALGMALPDSATVPAVDARRQQTAQRAGQRIVDMARCGGPTPGQVMTGEAFVNAIRTVAAIGGSTNAIIHLLAIAGRVGVPLCLDDFDRLTRDVPLLVDLMPSGRHLMEDFFYAGGLPAVLSELLEANLISPDALTVTGRTIGEEVNGAPCWDPEVIRPFSAPVRPAGDATAVLHGNICPDGAVIKVSAASRELTEHTGRALVFDSIEEYLRVADSDDLDVTADDILVVRNAGPRGYPGMPEIGNFPLPVKVLRKGVTDMIRISDARMSGTAYGTVILHVSPEAAAGGPLALVENGDIITLSVAERRLDMHVAAATLDARRAGLSAKPATSERGWVGLYVRHVLQADRGCDLDFLVGNSGAGVPRESH